MVGISTPRQGGPQSLVMPTDERRLARGAVHQDITNPWSTPHLPSGDMATMTGLEPAYIGIG